jgi:hypothetical protein
MNNLVGLAKRLLPEWVVLLRLMSERTGGNLNDLGDSGSRRDKTWTRTVEKATFMKASDGLRACL